MMASVLVCTLTSALLCDVICVVMRDFWCVAACPVTATAC